MQKKIIENTAVLVERQIYKKNTYTQYDRLTNRQKSRFIDKQKYTQKDSTYTNRLKEQAERLKNRKINKQVDQHT